MEWSWTSTWCTEEELVLPYDAYLRHKERQKKVTHFEINPGGGGGGHFEKKKKIIFVIWLFLTINEGWGSG